MLKIALSGYGRMGKEVEKAAHKAGHSILCKIDKPADWNENADLLLQCDVVIDFSLPQSASEAVNKCFDLGIPVVSGTTGWEAGLAAARLRCQSENKSFFYAPNFSIGVNIFFEINRRLSELLEDYSDYQPHIHEIHHIHKLDAPSGTAIALARGITENHSQYQQGWVAAPDQKPDHVSISSERTGEIPGTHIVTWASDTDSIEIKHTSHNRQALAQGAVKAAEWLAGKKGCFGMLDMLGINYSKKKY